MTITIDFPYVRIGSRELWIEPVSPRQRGAWFSLQRDTSGFHLGCLWWDVQLNRCAPG